MSRPNIKHGCVVGTGLAINVELGWIPDSVDLYNATDGTLVTTAYLIPWVVPFSSGGTAEVLAGANIRGATSAATATVDSILLMSGSWAAGTAAGFLTLKEGSLTGTFSSENIVITNLASGTVGTDDATVTVNVVHNLAIAAAAAAATGTSAISRYEGVAGSNAKGFTIGSVLSVDDKLLRYRALRGDVV